MKRMGLPAMICALALAAACNTNGRTTTTTDNANEPAAVGTAGDADRTAVQDSDKDFVNKMLADGNAEVELGQLAAERAANADVKRFGQMMVTDHSKAGDELKAIATQNGIQAAPALEDKHQDLMKRLSSLRGAEFDREYIDAMVDAHQDAVDSLQSRVDSTASLKDRITNSDSANAQVTPEETDNAPKAAVNEWAAKTLPAVQHHLDEAKRLDDAIDRRGTDTTRNTTTPPAPRK
jgi:putative membrane protein